jgi:hypothetical protein
MTHWRTTQETFVSLYDDEWSETIRAPVLRIAHDDRLGAMSRGAA